MFCEISVLVAYLGAFGEPAASTVADTAFVQEYAELHLPNKKSADNFMGCVAVGPGDTVYAGGRAGAFALAKGGDWVSLMDAETAGPVFAVAALVGGQVAFGAWNGLYLLNGGRFARVEGIDGPVSAVGEADGGVVALGPDGYWFVKDGRVESLPLFCSRSIRAVLADPLGALWVASGTGLWRHTAEGDTLYQAEEDILAADARGLALAADGALYVAGLGGVTIYRGGRRIGEHTAANGLPSPFTQAIAVAVDGTLWVGTDIGLARYDGRTWSLLHSRRWLPDDDVRGVALDSEGTAWVATCGGVGAIRRRAMTLREKADYFHEVTTLRHMRPPGLVEKCALRVPGDLATWEPEDDDNDGQYTAMYLAAESYRYAATQDPQARANARKACAALRLLQTVTGTPGFVARTVVPPDWTDVHDPGDTSSSAEWAEHRVADPRDKKVENRWRLSADRQWRWKGDTSSDEITGHFYGYACYYDLAADDAERELLRIHVAKVMDYIIDNGCVLLDIDGKHTRWGVWAPEYLNHDPDWAPERGVNSVEILSFLKAAYHITGDGKYQQAYLRLLHEAGYAANVRCAKAYGAAWRTHIDDELLALAWPALLRYETDPALVQLYREGLDHWYGGVERDESPFFNFIYSSLTGVVPHLAESVAFLRGAPLDLVNWTVDNSRRADVKLVRQPELEFVQTDRLLPVGERGVVRWDANPWKAVQGDGGRSERAPTYWLLPYWIGRYYGYFDG